MPFLTSNLPAKSKQSNWGGILGGLLGGAPGALLGTAAQGMGFGTRGGGGGTTGTGTGSGAAQKDKQKQQQASQQAQQQAISSGQALVARVLENEARRQAEAKPKTFADAVMNRGGGLRGATGPGGEARVQPSSFGTSYQTAQMMRGAYPSVADRTTQSGLASALNTFAGAMPGEAFIDRYGAGAMNNVGRVGLNQIIGGASPQTMLNRMDTTGMGPRGTAGFARPGPNSMGMQAPGSPYQTMAAAALQEALMGRGVSPEAMNASNFVAAGTRLPRGVEPVGSPVAGTQFGIDPAWRDRIATANTAAAADQPQRVASSQTTGLPSIPNDAAAYGLAYRPSPMEQDFAYLGGRVGPYVDGNGTVVPEAEAMAAMNPDFARALAQDMRKAESATGATGTIINAYRSPASQGRLYEMGRGKWPVSEPGTSLHQYGEAIDVAPGPVRDYLRAQASQGRLMAGGFPIRNDPGHLAYNNASAPPRDVRQANAGLSPFGIGGPAGQTYSPGAVAAIRMGQDAPNQKTPALANAALPTAALPNFPFAGPLANMGRTMAYGLSDFRIPSQQQMAAAMPQVPQPGQIALAQMIPGLATGTADAVKAGLGNLIASGQDYLRSTGASAPTQLASAPSGNFGPIPGMTQLASLKQEVKKAKDDIKKLPKNFTTAMLDPKTWASLTQAQKDQWRAMSNRSGQKSLMDNFGDGFESPKKDDPKAKKKRKPALPAWDPYNVVWDFPKYTQLWAGRPPKPPRA